MAARAPRGSRSRKKSVESASRGLTPKEVAAGAPPAVIQGLQGDVDADGGRVLAVYRDPLGGHWQLLAALPLAAVRPTPYQRDLSETHAALLATRIGELDRFLDPIIAYRRGPGEYWTPNGRHRLAALERLGARSVAALVLPDQDIAYKILALNTEKAHNVREKSLEVIRMARALAALDPRPEREFAVEFEEPAFLTLGICYERKGRFSGGAYQPVLKRVEEFSGAKLPAALARREERAARLLELDEAVAAAVKALQARGFQSAYLKAFVIARINPLRFQRGAKADPDAVLEKMLAAAKRFDATRVKADQVTRAGGPPDAAD